MALPQAVRRNQNSLGRVVRDIRQQHGITDLARNIRRISASATRFVNDKRRISRTVELTPATSGETEFPAGVYPWVLEEVIVAKVPLPMLAAITTLDDYGYVYEKGADVFQTTEAGSLHSITFRERVRDPGDPSSTGYDLLESHFDLLFNAILFRALEFYKMHDEASRALEMLNGIMDNERDADELNQLSGLNLHARLDIP